MAKNYKKAFYMLVKQIKLEKEWNQEDMEDPKSGLLEEGFDLACDRILEIAEKIKVGDYSYLY